MILLAAGRRSAFCFYLVRDKVKTIRGKSGPEGKGVNMKSLGQVAIIAVGGLIALMIYFGCVVPAAAVVGVKLFGGP